MDSVVPALMKTDENLAISIGRGRMYRDCGTSISDSSMQGGIAVGVISSSSVISTGLRAMLEQVKLVEFVGYPNPDLSSLSSYDMLIVLDDCIDMVPLGINARVLVAVTSLVDARATVGSPRAVVADGYFEIANLSPSILGEVVRLCLAGAYPIPPGMLRGLMGKRTAGSSIRSAYAITAREKETLEYIADGLSNDQVARKLGISPHGVKRLIASAMVKLDSPNRTAAVIEAIRLGILQCPNQHCAGHSAVYKGIYGGPTDAHDDGR
ncbi:response regulator transcription factor [Nocardia sp. 004]|uniref:response regulator transcription factor n=1 Tax=Nocardia sp. 004 TaxID=3385978 RepID=UPI0039A3E0D2